VGRHGVRHELVSDNPHETVANDEETSLHVTGRTRRRSRARIAPSAELAVPARITAAWTTAVLT